MKANPMLQNLLQRIIAAEHKLIERIDKNATLRAVFARIPLRMVLALVALILFAVLPAFIVYEVGSTHDAHVYADIKRISNLQQLRLDINKYTLDNGQLPSKLDDIITADFNPNYQRDNYFYDPENHSLFDYKVTSANLYSLCATFNFSSSAMAEKLPMSSIDEQTWGHAPGYHCFDFTVSVQ